MFILCNFTNTYLYQCLHWSCSIHTMFVFYLRSSFWYKNFLFQIFPLAVSSMRGLLLVKFLQFIFFLKDCFTVHLIMGFLVFSSALWRYCGVNFTHPEWDLLCILILRIYISFINSSHYLFELPLPHSTLLSLESPIRYSLDLSGSSVSVTSSFIVFLSHFISAPLPSLAFW